MVFLRNSLDKVLEGKVRPWEHDSEGNKGGSYTEMYTKLIGIWVGGGAGEERRKEEEKERVLQKSRKWELKLKKGPNGDM